MFMLPKERDYRSDCGRLCLGLQTLGIQMDFFMTFSLRLFRVVVAGLITVSLAFPCWAEAIVQRSHVSSLSSFQFTQDGRFLVTAARDGEVLLWDVETGKLLRELRPVREWSGGYGAKFDLDGSRVLICDNDGVSTTIQLLDLETGQSLRVLTPPKQVSIQMPQFSRDGRFIFAPAQSRQAQGLLGWEAESGDLILKLEPSTPELNDRVAKLMKLFDSVSRKPPWVTADILECLVILKKALQNRGESLADGIRIGRSGIGVRFSPNGRIAVCNDWNDTGSSDEDVSVWDFESCRLLHSFMEPYRYLEHVLFSSDGQYFLVGHMRDKLQVRSCKTGELIRKIAHPEGKIMAMAMSPKDQWIATGGADGSVTIWNASDGTSLRQLLSEGEVTSIEFSPDAQSMVVTRKEHSIVVYATKDWHPVCKVSGATGEVPDVTGIVQFSPDSRRLLVANKNRLSRMTNVALFALPSGEKIGTIAETPICDLMISPDGNWALGVPTTTRYSRNRALARLLLWNARTGALLHRFEAGTFFLERPGRWAQKSAVPGGRIQSTPIRSAATLRPWETPTPWRALRYEPHLRPVAEDVLSQIRELDDPGRQWLEGMLKERATDTGPVEPRFYSSDGRYLVVRTTGMEVGAKLRDAHTGQAVQKFRQMLRFAFSPTGDRFVSWSPGGRVASHLWNFKNGRMLADLSTELGPGCRNVCFSPDGELLMTHHVRSNRRDIIGFWNAKSGDKIRGKHISSLVNHPKSKPFFVDKTRCITVQHDGAQLWDAQQGILLHYFEAKRHLDNRVVLNPEKSKLLVVTPGKHGILWDMATGEQGQVFEGMRGDVKFTSNQQLLLEHCRNGQLVKVWDLASGQLLRQMYASSDGQKLLVE